MNRIELYQKAKKGNEDVVVVEGVHAFKHAARFGADFIDVVTCDKKFVIDLMGHIATNDDVTMLEKKVVEIDQNLFDAITSDSLRTKMTALAIKPQGRSADDDKLVVFLENPRDIDNVGAVMRVAAAAGVGSVCVSGEVNPWHLHAIRAGAGLQFALDVVHVDSIEEIITSYGKQRNIYTCDADGKNMQTIQIQKNAILVFGTERDGVSKSVIKQSDFVISIPMQVGVSSLNLATSVSAVLYGSQFC